jgi:tRNA modification GTPase
LIYDTIAAISSPHGTGAISIIRITGELSLKIVEESLKNQKTQSKKMCFGYFYSEEKKLDEITWVFHQAPYSFTGEDMLEIFCHGGKIITEKIFQSILKKGIREAVAGEFSKRAVLNGKMDLIKAESINNLIHAKTDKSADFFSNQMNNGISSEIDKIKEFLLNQIAEIEVSMDYPDDFELDSEKIKDTLKNTLEEIENILKNSENGLIISEGIKTVIIGKPNSGKSTLLNSLLKKDRAIVTDIPGTTRDTIEEDLNISGIHIKIIDTAGIRETEDKVEKIGIEKTNKAIE